MVEEVSGVPGQRFDAPEERKDCSAAVDPRVYDIGVGTDDERVLEDSGWWRRCPVFLGSGSTLPKNERIAARRWLIRPRIRPESKLQDKCFERTAALDVENTMCRVNGIGSNAGAWDAADQRIEAAGRRGGLCDSVTRRLLPAITITTTNVHARKDLPPPRRHPRAGARGIPTGCLSARPGTAEGSRPLLPCWQTHAVLTPALADAIWHVARAPAVEKLVDEHPADFHLMDSAGYFFSAIRRNAAPTYVPSEEDVLRARAKSTAIIETRFWMGGLIACVRRCLGAGLYWRMATSTTEEEKTQMQCRQTRRFGVLCGSLRRLFLSSLFSLLIFFLLDPSFRLNRMRGPLYLFESVINSLWFLRTSVILFLNKIDVFKRNIVSRPSLSPRATTSTSRALGAARAAATAPVTSAVGYSTPFSPPVRPARGRYLRD
ncbi:G-protein alpha subunit-domain-containing protein [Mycena olivaceomarginata]|nr:G-protein alpha subunit-domain-containing protein [Mycena olivaceomarginata]